MKRTLIIIASLAVAGSASAFDTILSTGHADIAVGYSNGSWDLHVHDDLEEYHPEDVLLQVLNDGQTNRPGGSQWDFMGVGAGSTIWVLPQTFNPNLLYLGIVAEEIDSGIFDNNEVFWNLKSLSGPGHFSVWQSDTFGNPLVRMASSDGFSSADRFTVPVGGHQHTNFGFTAEGFYEVGLSVGGFIGGNWVESDIETYNFQVVPEPATMAAVGLGVAALMRRRRR